MVHDFHWLKEEMYMEKNEMIFIVGVARTGSKVYMNFLNVSEKINISEELHYRIPRYIKKDTYSILKSEVPEDKLDISIDKIADILFSEMIKNTGFFAVVKFTNSELVEFLEENKPLDYKKLFDLLIRLDAIKNRKVTGGAKFAVNILKINWLVKNYPNAKYINITRDPRAIYCSMYRKDINLKKYRFIFLLKIKRLIYIILQYRGQYRFHEAYKNNSNYYFSKYEDLIDNPENKIKKICEFVNIEYKEEMLSPPINGSSFQESGGHGIHRAGIDRWKKIIRRWELSILNLFLAKIIREYGYDLRD